MVNPVVSKSLYLVDKAMQHKGGNGGKKADEEREDKDSLPLGYMKPAPGYKADYGRAVGH